MHDPRWHCRIGKVTRKDGRGTLRVLDRKGHDRCPEELLKTFQDHSAFLLKQFATNAAGFVIVIWGRDGRWSRGRSVTASSPFGPTAIPGIVADILRRDIMADVTRGVLNGEE